MNEWDKPTKREKFQNAGETLTWTVNGYCGAQGWRKEDFVWRNFSRDYRPKESY